MHITREDFTRAATEAALTPSQAESMWLALERTAAPLAPPPPLPSTGGVKPSRFDVAHLAYYFGGLLVLGAMGWFMTLAWSAFGDGGVCAIAVGYAALFVLFGRRLWKRDETRTPGGMMFTLAVGMTPLAVYGLERALGWWPAEDPGD